VIFLKAKDRITVYNVGFLGEQIPRRASSNWATGAGCWFPDCAGHAIYSLILARGQFCSTSFTAWTSWSTSYPLCPANNPPSKTNISQPGVFWWETLAQGHFWPQCTYELHYTLPVLLSSSFWFLFSSGVKFICTLWSVYSYSLPISVLRFFLKKCLAHLTPCLLSKNSHNAQSCWSLMFYSWGNKKESRMD
jgi:hypothetical protein